MEEIRFGTVLMELPDSRSDLSDFSWQTQVGNVSNSLSSSQSVVRVRSVPNY
jgi:hypothetical protein